jgi:hypothetical protein
MNSQTMEADIRNDNFIHFSDVRRARNWELPLEILSLQISGAAKAAVCDRFG